MRTLLCAFAISISLVDFSPLAVAATPAISAGSSHSVALNADGTIRNWGNDASGQLGIGRSLASATPSVVAGATGIIAIASGFSHVIALKADGTVLAWGDNTDGQLGDGSTTNRSSPAAVMGLTDVEKIWARGSYNFARKRDGSF
jgi:alpha-tubulin suppressor-like RCC1 family protein